MPPVQPARGVCLTPTADLSDRLGVRLDPEAPPGNVVPLLARLLRRLRDRERATRPSIPTVDAGDRPAAA